MRTLFDPSLPFLKGNLHMHSTRSDGRLSPDEALRFFQARGYDFVALTDHWRPCEAGSFHGMTVLPGVELDAEPDGDQVAHIVGAGFDPEKLALPGAGAGAQALIDAIRAADGIAILAHPAWSMNTVDFILSLKGLSAAEIFNTFSGIPWNAGRADSSCILDLAATKGAVLPLVASDDCHCYAGEQGVSRTMVNARDSSVEAITGALRDGRFFATQGPLFSQISVDGRYVTVECSPVDRVVFYSNIQWSEHRCFSGQNLTFVRYRLEEAERYIRVELIDRFGRRAWSSPAVVEI